MQSLYRILFFMLFYCVALTTQAKSWLAETEWLAQALTRPDLVLIDMSDGLQYSRFHLPGAINLPYEYLTESRKGVSLSIGQTRLTELLGQLGITADKQIVIYDDTGGLHAARLFWELEQLGHEKVSILNGGLVKWVREARPVTGEAPVIKSVKYKAARTGTAATANLDDVLKAKQGNALLLDVRSEEEYIGNKEHKRSGHIPGARWWEWDQALDTKNGFVLHELDLLKQSLSQAGVGNPDEEIIVYCNSGHRASHTYLLLREMGFSKVKLYDGSIQEYARQPTLPLKLGKQP